MPRAKISEFSTIAGDNTDIDGINLAEGMAPSLVNDAIRELMAQLKDFQSGAAGDNITVVGTLAAKGTSSSGADLKLYEDTDNGTNYVGFIAPASIASNVQWTLPSADGSSGQALQTNGSGTLSFATLGISAGGTGQTTANAAFNALAPSQTSNAGRYLKTDGTNTSWDLLDISTADITGTLPVANGGTGITSFGTGVATALGINVGSSGAFVTNGGALGTPSSGTVTNLTGTASININGTVGATTPNTGSFTTLTTSSTVTHNGGTANGVAYLDGSKVLTTGSALTFDGTNISTALGGSYYSANANYGFGTPDSAGLQIFAASGDSIRFGSRSAGTFSEQMRLTSTGLGIGTSSPTAAKLHIAGYNGGAVYPIRMTSTNSGVEWAFETGGTNAATSFLAIRDIGNSSTPITINSSGNLGLGVTPSAWTNSFGVIQGLGGWSISHNGANSNSVDFLSNAYRSGGANTYLYVASANATRYQQLAGVHAWYTAPSGTAGNAISFTQAMDLANSSGASTLTVNSAINTASAVRLTTNGGLTAGMFLAAPTADHSLGFQTAGSERARITSGGSLQIGSTTSAGARTFIYDNRSNSANGDEAALCVREDGTNAIQSWLGTGGSERARITSDGILQLRSGLSGNQLQFWNTAGSAEVARVGANSGALAFMVGSTSVESARIDSSGNLMVADTSPAYSFSGRGNITIGGTSGSILGFRINSVNKGYIYHDGTNLDVNNVANGYLSFATNNTERARITSGGYFKASNNGTYFASTGVHHELYSNASSDWISYFTQATATSPNGVVIQYTAAAPNGTGNPFLYCQDTAVVRASIRSNGGIANYQGNDANLSDRREKTNFAPAKSYLDTICAIPVQTFNYIDQSENDPGLTLGVVAQDVQAVAPELVTESDWSAEKDGSKMRLSIYQTDLQYALMKCIQELKAQNDDLRARVAALES